MKTIIRIIVDSESAGIGKLIDNLFTVDVSTLDEIYSILFSGAASGKVDSVDPSEEWETLLDDMRKERDTFRGEN